MIIEENSKPKAKQPTLLDQQAVMLKKGAEQLNKQSEMILKQQNEGMNNFFELEAMKYASESDMKEYFWTVLEHTILMEKKQLLASQIKHQELFKKLNE